jgi:CubicO group peptidase (beta-lactamase class C family)
MRRQTVRAFGICAAIAILLNANASALAAPVDDLIKSEMQKLNIPGISLAVIKDRKIIKLAGYGLSNIETETAATPDSVYKIASLSKPFIATALLLLVDENKVRLDDKISPYLEGAPPSWQSITIRQVMSHISGIPRDPADYHPYEQQKPGAVIASAYALPLVFQPGEKFLYSNVGYYILAQIVEKASGMPWETFVADRLFRPAGLTATRPLTAGIIKGRASGYDLTDGQLMNAENWIAARPSAAFLSTVRDLAAWDIFLDTRNPLSSASWAQVHAPAKLNDGRTGDYGLGWYVESYLGHARIHHDGQYPGFRSDWERFEDDKLTVIILSNAGRPRVDSLALKVAGYFVPALSAPTLHVSARLPTGPVSAGAATSISFMLQSDKPAPKSVLELEIWDAQNKTVNKQNLTGQDIPAGSGKVFDFVWTPTKPGRYWVNLGVYGPKFSPNYSWSEHAGALTVE